jgi:FAD synthetase
MQSQREQGSRQENQKPETRNQQLSVKRILVFGTFDLLHPGHLFLLNEAQRRGELHVVIARDANVEKIKGKLPQQNEEERLKKLQEAFPESHPRLGDEKDFLVPVREIQPDLILFGYDQKLPHGISEEDR